MSFHYQPLSEIHLAGYRQIRLECLQLHPQHFGSDYEEELHATKLSFDDALKGKTESDFLLGAFDGEQLVGICGYKREHGSKRQHRGNISHLYVRAAYNGRGIATQMMKQTLQRAFENAAIDLVTLGVSDVNPQALHLYTKLGFQQCGHLPQHFKIEGQSLGLYSMFIGRQHFEANR